MVGRLALPLLIAGALCGAAACWPRLHHGRVSPPVALAAQAVAAPAPSTPMPAPVAQTFPLSEGAAWVYQGQVTYQTPSGGSKVFTETKTWRMEVTATEAKDGWTVARVKGHPQDLAWYEPGKPRGLYEIAHDGTGGYYLFSAESGLPNGVPQDPSPTDLFLKLPLSTGQDFAVDSSLPRRSDHAYCWHVDGVDQRRVSTVKGLPDAMYTAYRLTYLTGPDETHVEFVPGVGLTAYTYIHHGSPSEAHLRLVEFAPGA